MLTPDTSHGTNPASVTMAGYEVVKVATNERGGVEMDDLRAKVDDDVACLMLTNPNTLGLFDENIDEIAALIHEAGGTLYYDGANLNAVMGHSRPGDMGFDIVHVNLHKSFSQPHGGGGPGAGPIAVSERIEPFLPRPQVVRREGANGGGPRFDLDFDRPKSIGRLRGFQGNFGVFVRSYAYILSLGADGLAEASETAVLNANYLKARLAEGRAGKHLPVAFDRHCMHEFVLSGTPMKTRARAHDPRPRQAPARLRLPPADRLLPAAGRRGADDRADRDRDEGEPRRLRRRRSSEILAEAEADPEIARSAPYTTPVRRLDEVRATRRPVVRSRPDRRTRFALSVRRTHLASVRAPAAPAELEHRGEEVAVLLDPLQHVAGLEDERAGRRPLSAASPRPRPR